MDISLYKRNMDFLKEKFPGFYEKLKSPAFHVSELKVSDMGDDGNLQIALGDARCALHSTYDIDREMEILFRPLTRDDNQVIVIFGFGCGHCLDYIKRKHIKYKRLVIFEPCSNIFLEVLKKRSVNKLLDMYELPLQLFETPNVMAHYLHSMALESKTLTMLTHLSYMSLFKDVYDEVLRVFRSERISLDTSIVTVQARSNEWNTHQLKSIQRSGRSADVFVGRFKGVPAILASAGPSLEKHFDLLRAIGDRALIVAPGSSARILNARGIDAQFTMATDSSAIEAGYFKDYRLNSVLVASYRIHPDLYNNFPNDIYRVVMNTEYLTQYYYDWLVEKPFILFDHTSVSSAALDFLVLMGCDPIIIVGQDLSFSGDRNYADEAAGTMAEKLRRMQIEDVDIYGQKIFTYNAYKAIQHSMENQGIQYRDTVAIVNATEGGLGIPGIKNVRFADMYEQYIKDRAPDVKERMAAAAREAKVVGMMDILNGGEAPTAKTIESFFTNLLESCEQVEALIAEKESRFNALAKLVKRGMPDNRLNGEMRLIEGYNARLDAIPFFKQVIAPSLEILLLYYRATSKHAANAGREWEGAMGYQRIFDEQVLALVTKFRLFLLREMISDPTKGLEQFGVPAAASDAPAGTAANPA